MTNNTPPAHEPSSSDDLPASEEKDLVKSIGGYHIIELLGRGGMGVVYRAKHATQTHHVALKTLRAPEALLLTQMRTEIESLARLQHPGIVQILAHGMHDNRPWYAMDLVDGITLQELCKQLHPHMTGHSRSRFTHDSFLSIGSLLQYGSKPVEWPQPPQTSDDEKTHTVLKGSSTFGAVPPAQQKGEDVPWWTKEVEDLTIDIPALQKLKAPAEPIQFSLLPTPQAPEETEPETEQLPETSPLPTVSSTRIIHHTNTTLSRTRLTQQQWNAILTLLHRLCAPLAYLHSQGIVHRDLKPSNILLRPDGTPVLVDFGLSSITDHHTHRAQLRDNRNTFGTPAYMSPEQIKGEQVDARSDLYALGCIFYKVLTGHHPFPRGNRIETYKHHLYTSPMPLAVYLEDVPAPLEALMGRLLAKLPQQRIGYAEDVASWLLRLGASPPDTPTPITKPFLFSPGLVQRRELCTTLLHHTTRSNPQDPTILCLEGESGLGKTRLLNEVLYQTKQKDALVLIGQCTPPRHEQQRPLQAMSRPLREIGDLCLGKEPSFLQKVFGHRISVFALYEPSLLDLPGARQLPPPEQLRPAQAHDRLANYLLQTLQAAAQTHHPVLIIDNAQWIDIHTLHFLRFACEQGRHTTLRVVLSYRTDTPNPTLESFLEQTSTPRLTMTRLDHDGIEEMLSNMLALTAPPKPFVDQLTTLSQGNPLFVSEYIQLALDMGYLTRDKAGEWNFTEHIEQDTTLTLPLPNSLQQLLLQKINRLKHTQRSILEWAAVWRSHFDEATLHACLPHENKELTKSLFALIHQGMLELSADNTIGFASEPTQSLVLTHIPSEKRKALHHTAAELLEQRARIAQDISYADLAYHWEHAQDPQKAACAHLQAGRRAVPLYALHEAKEHYEWFVQTVPHQHQEWIDAVLELVHDVYTPLGMFEASLPLLDEAFTLATTQGSPLSIAKTTLRQGQTHRLLGALDTADTLLHKAHELFVTLDDLTGQAECLHTLTIIQAMQGHFTQAALYSESALTLWRTLENQTEIENTLNNLAAIQFEQNHYDNAESRYLEGLALAKQNEKPFLQGKMLNNLAMICLETGRYQQATEYATQALDIRRSLGDRKGEGSVLATLALLAQSQKEWDAAHKYLTYSLAIWDDIKDLHNKGYAHINMGAVLRDLARYEEAQAQFAQGLSIAKQLKSPRMEGYAHLYRATLQRYLGQYDAARQSAQLAQQLFDEQHIEGCSLQTLCETAHIALATDTMCGDVCEQVRQTATRLELSPSSVFMQAVQRLDRALRCVQTQQPLFHGESPADTPPNVLTLATSNTP
ncbi:MAG TPA: hypothetical protein DCE42_28865 [Myxococcales bacterium]|nr:hypothetical protein [Deltaproteobacteria bacterium]HAA58809.1 hypothetical protein [Myxococcales bacterium]